MPPASQEQKIAQFYDSQTSVYDSGYAEPICVAEDNIVSEILQSIVKGKTLDVGCGTGLFLNLAKPESYVGLEISYSMVAQAKKKFPDAQFIHGDQGRIPTRDASFDSLVSLYGPFSYSLSPEQVLMEFKRVLKPGGGFAIMPYTLRVGHALAMGGYTTATHPEIEKIFYTTAELKKLFVDFNDVHIRGINYSVNNLIEFAATMNQPEFSIPALTELLKSENKMSELLPVEFARHCIVTGNT